LALFRRNQAEFDESPWARLRLAALSIWPAPGCCPYGFGVTDGHLSRVLRRVSYKTPGPELARRVAIALGLPPDYFPEYRRGFVLERIRTDAVLCDELYAKVTGEKSLDVVPELRSGWRAARCVAGAGGSGTQRARARRSPHRSAWHARAGFRHRRPRDQRVLQVGSVRIEHRASTFSCTSRIAEPAVRPSRRRGGRHRSACSP
jgi:hypothetical protein